MIRRHTGINYWLPILIAVGALVLASDLPTRQALVGTNVIDGPYASLLAASIDLGPARAEQVQLTAELQDQSRPVALIEWAHGNELSVRWRPGDGWAVIGGASDSVARAFAVTVHDYRGKRGQQFYASPQQPAVPAPLRAEVAGLGRIMGYTPYHESSPDLKLDVPDRGLTPNALLTTYDVEKLSAAGYTGKGVTLVIFAFNGFNQTDLDTFSTLFSLPRFTPEVVGGDPGGATGETTMDLEVAHAIAPGARKIVVNARPTVEGDGAYQKIGQMMENTDRAYPGAVWSFSIGWGCDKLLTAADLAPVRSALRTAQSHGTTAFNASGDLAGLECKGGDDWDSPPGPADVGLDSMSSLPEMTSVGGTTLSTDARGVWLSEQTWFDVPLSQGTSGGVSSLFNLPGWQRRAAGQVPAARRIGKRMTPDISAVADPFTGVKIVLDNNVVVGGGTSQSAPIWAGLAAVMDQYLLTNGGMLIGELNPLLYRIADGAPRPAFRDITLGGNAVDSAGPGYDLVSGLGTPNIDNLVRNLLVAQGISA